MTTCPLCGNPEHRDADEQWDLFLVNAANGEVKNLTSTPAVSEEGPLWSPDGHALAYAVKPRAAPNYEIGLWDARSGRARTLTRGTPADLSLAPVAFVPGGPDSGTFRTVPSRSTL